MRAVLCNEKWILFYIIKCLSSLCDWQRAWNIKRLAKCSLVSDQGSLTSTFFVRNRSRRKEKCLILSGHSEFIPFLFGWLVASGGFQATVPYKWSILSKFRVNQVNWYQFIQKLGSVVGTVIQANGRLPFEDNLRSGGLLYFTTKWTSVRTELADSMVNLGEPGGG